MCRVGSHYSQVFNTQMMIDLAAEKATILKTVYEQNKIVPILVYSGFSGSTFAMAISMALHNLNIPFEQMYVRKVDEISHGQSIESSTSYLQSKHHFLVFVDDFISTGDTLKYVIEKAVTRFKEQSVVRPYVLVLTQYSLPGGFFSISISEILSASTYQEYTNKGIVLLQKQNFVGLHDRPETFVKFDEQDWLDGKKATCVFNLKTNQVEVQF